MLDMDAKENIDIKSHIKFIRAHLVSLPSDYESYCNNNLMFLFFVVSGLDIFGIDKEFNEELKSAICDRVYLCQTQMQDPVSGCLIASFKGTNLLNIQPSVEIFKDNSKYLFCGEIAMTYMALLILIILDDDLSRLNKDAILCMINLTQMSSGCFSVSPFERDTDMRFSYCAVGICAILDCYDTINIPKLLSYIESCFNYDGGFSQIPGLESHSGSTFCAISAIYIIEKHCIKHSYLARDLLNRIQMPCLRWCVQRANHFTNGGGYNGRPQKIADTCYSFWTGGTIKILSEHLHSNISHFNFVDIHSINYHSLMAQDPIRGGLSKHPFSDSDILHTYFGICGLSILNIYPQLRVIEPAFMISRDIYLRYFNKKTSLK